MKFRRTSAFTRRWDKLGYGDEDQDELESLLTEKPEAGDLIKGTGGVRKLRYALPGNKGKSSGSRICYYFQSSEGTIFLMVIYPKSEKDNLTKKERNTLRDIVKTLKK